MKFADLKPGDVVINYSGRLARLVVSIEKRWGGWDGRWLTLWTHLTPGKRNVGMYMTNYGMEDHMHDGYKIWRGTP